MITINYTITCSQQVDESVYSDAWNEDNDTPWSELSDQKKVDYIREVESDNAFEALQEKISEADPVITVTLS